MRTRPCPPLEPTRARRNATQNAPPSGGAPQPAIHEMNRPGSLRAYDIDLLPSPRHDDHVAEPDLSVRPQADRARSVHVRGALDHCCHLAIAVVQIAEKAVVHSRRLDKVFFVVSE